MKLYQYIRSLILAFVALSLSACFNDDYLLQTEGENVSITFRPTLGGELGTRAIGDAAGIDRLTVAVYEGSQSLSKKFSVSKDWNTAKTNGIELTLIEGRSYKILFWAENGGNSAYTITDDGRITVNYDDYTNGDFDKMEEMDAFFGTSSITVGSQKVEDNGTITLSRPLAQLNFADNATQPETGTHRTEVTFHGIATAFNPFTGEVEMSDMDKTFVFTEFPTETMSIDGSTYYYLSSNYLFAPQTGTLNVSTTIDLQNTDGTSIKTIELSGITLEKNKKTNVTGSIVQQPETWSVWDGESKTQPEPDAPNHYIINEAADIAWLCENGSTLSENSIFLQTKDIDMASKAIASIKLPAGSTYDGGGKTIKNYANSLFGDATALKVKDLAVENITVSGSNHTGTLANTLKGSSSFTNVSVSNGTVTTTNGAAGGMIGYIVRTTEKDRSETLNVSFAGCKLNGVSVSGSASEGKFVGLLSGYDNNESLTFDNVCEATNVSVTDYASVYTKANNSAWVTEDVTNKYDGWLGTETYRRAKITFGGVRLAPRWDGTTVTAKADLLLYNGESNKYEVHSAFDLAGVRNDTASPAALYLMESVDMYGQGADGKYFMHSSFTKSASDAAYSTTDDDDNHFRPFDSIKNLDGKKNNTENYGIYNLSIYTNKSTDRAAFILSGDNGHIHKNIDFHNCCTVVPHIEGTDDGQTVDKSYGATVVLSVGGATYTMENVHAYDCKVFALQKTAILAGRVVSTSLATINNCSVNNSYIENYKCQCHYQTFKKLFVTAKFYSYGEVGGLIGFVENFAKISNCHVRGTTIHAYGQDNQLGGLVPGRHVGQFIGGIRTSGNNGDKIELTKCTVSNTDCTQTWHKHSKCTMIGSVYYVLTSDSKGTVTLDGKSIF